MTMLNAKQVVLRVSLVSLLGLHVSLRSHFTENEE